MTAFRPMFAFVIASAAGDILVKGVDQKRNAITAALVNTSDGDLMLKAGGDSAAEVDLDFDGLLNSHELESLAITADGLTAELDKTAAPYVWRLRPTADLRWGKGARIAMAIAPGSVGADSETGPYSIAATCLNLRDAADLGRIAEEKTRTASLILAPNIEQPRKNLKEVLGCFAQPSKILTWNRTPEPITNSFTLALTNFQREDPLLPADGPAGQPVFKIVFPTLPRPEGDEQLIAADALRTLTYADLAADIEINLPLDAPWEIKKYNQELYWELKPKAGNTTLMDGGDSLVLTVSGIRSPLSPPNGAYPTRVYVLYSGVGDYDPGYFSTVLFKTEPEPQILSFKARDSEVDYGIGTALSWTTIGAERLEITFAKGPDTIRWSSSDGPEGRAFRCDSDFIEIPLKGSELTETTTYTLSLFRDGMVLREVATVSVRRPELSFTATPAVASGGKATLDWAINGQWPITSLTIAMDGRVFYDLKNAKGSTPSPPISDTAGFTLTAVVGTPKPLTLTSVVKTIVEHARVSLKGPDNMLAFGDDATLEWSADFVNCLELFTPGESSASRLLVTDATLHADGKVTLKPQRSTTYTLHGEGHGGSAVATKTVAVNAVDVLEFVVRPSSPPDGHVWREDEGWRDALELPAIGYWDVEVACRFAYATAVRIEQTGMDPVVVWSARRDGRFDPNIGEPTPMPEPGSRFKLRFRPLGDCTLTFCAEGPGGPAKRSLEVRHQRGPRVSRASMSVQNEGTSTVLAFDWAGSGSRFALGIRDRSTPFPGKITTTEHPNINDCFTRMVDLDGPRSFPWHALLNNVDEIWRNPSLLDKTLKSRAFYVVAWGDGGGLPAIHAAVR